jgi:hypothetical protein
VRAGDSYTASLKGCEETKATVVTPDGKSHELKSGPPDWSTELTGPGIDPGHYNLTFKCGDADAGTATLTVVEQKLPKLDAFITPNPFHDGDRLTLTTTGCPSIPTVEDVDGLFTGSLELKKIGDLKYQGSAVTETNLGNKIFHLVVDCDGLKITFTTSPGKRAKKQHGGQTGVVPSGGVDTGDGSSLQGGGTAVLPIAAGASGVVLAAAFGLAYRRRKAQEDA